MEEASVMMIKCKSCLKIPSSERQLILKQKEPISYLINANKAIINNGKRVLRKNPLRNIR